MTQEYVDGALVQKMLPLEEIPTYKRFWTYCKKQGGENGIMPLKMSAKEQEKQRKASSGKQPERLCRSPAISWRSMR